MTNPSGVDHESREKHESIILDHDAHPRNYGALRDATHSSEVYNPLCGDRYTIYVRVVGNSIDRTKFDGHGCAVSRASGSIMTTMVEGMSTAQADALASATVEFLVSGEPQDPRCLGDLCAFEGIHRFPTRRQCALLAWTALRNALAQKIG